MSTGRSYADLWKEHQRLAAEVERSNADLKGAVKRLDEVQGQYKADCLDHELKGQPPPEAPNTAVLESDVLRLRDEKVAAETAVGKLELEAAAQDPEMARWLSEGLPPAPQQEKVDIEHVVEVADAAWETSKLVGKAYVGEDIPGSEFEFGYLKPVVEAAKVFVAAVETKNLLLDGLAAADVQSPQVAYENAVRGVFADQEVARQINDKIAEQNKEREELQKQCAAERQNLHDRLEKYATDPLLIQGSLDRQTETHEALLKGQEQRHAAELEKFQQQLIDEKIKAEQERQGQERAGQQAALWNKILDDGPQR